MCEEVRGGVSGQVCVGQGKAKQRELLLLLLVLLLLLLLLKTHHRRAASSLTHTTCQVWTHRFGVTMTSNWCGLDTSCMHLHRQHRTTTATSLVHPVTQKNKNVWHSLGEQCHADTLFACKHFATDVLFCERLGGCSKAGAQDAGGLLLLPWCTPKTRADSQGIYPP